MPAVDRAINLLQESLALLSRPPLQDGSFCRISVAYPKNRMLVLAEEHAERDASAGSSLWTAAEVAEFAQASERTPSSQKDLFDLASSRLDNIKFDLEEGDESEATILQRVANEIELRVSLTGRLRRTARGKYSIAAEEELANKDRTDIRLHNAAVEGRIPIEVKIAGQWQAAHLSERMENQLIRQYMKESRFGIFLVVN